MLFLYKHNVITNEELSLEQRRQCEEVMDLFSKTLASAVYGTFSETLRPCLDSRGRELIIVADAFNLFKIKLSTFEDYKTLMRRLNETSENGEIATKVVYPNFYSDFENCRVTLKVYYKPSDEPLVFPDELIEEQNEAAESIAKLTKRSPDEVLESFKEIRQMVGEDTLDQEKIMEIIRKLIRTEWD